MSFGGLYISVTGMQTTKTSLDTISHNIANTGNPIYVRQSAIHKDSFYQNGQMGAYSTAQSGKGASIAQIRQIRDEFLDKQIRRELPKMGYHRAKADALTDVEAVFNEITSSGLQNVLDDFWNSWHEANKNPEELTVRGLVAESGQAFVETVHRIGKQLNDIQKNIDTELEVKGRETNDILKRIAVLNGEIRLAETEGPLVKYNDKRDEQNALLDRLSQLLPVDIYEDNFGGAIVSLNGRSLVEEGTAVQLDVKADKNSNRGHIQVYWENSREEIDLSANGELGALIHVRDVSIVGYQDRVDTLVQEVAESVNELHMKGHGLDYQEGEEYTHIPFFVLEDADFDISNPPAKGQIKASNIKLHPDIVYLNKIAISATGDTGDGDIAKQMYELRNSKIKLIDNNNKDGLELSQDDYYRRIITDVGLERQDALNSLKSQQFLVKSIDENRAAISKVSLDEEMAELVKYQYSYMANSRVFNAVDEMIDVVVNRVGLVGR